MEFEDVSEEVEWEARRIAAAFEMQEFGQVEPDSGAIGSSICFGGDIGETTFYCEVDIQTKKWVTVRLVDFGGFCCVFQIESTEEWDYFTYPPLHEQMARGLYRLGFEDEDVLAEFNHLLTAHEKLELRLSMPREFRPQKWLDE